MAEDFPPRPDQPRVASSPNRKDLMLALSTYDALFHEIDDNHPEADIRQRFLGWRAVRSNHVEGEVMQCGRGYDELMKDLREGKLDPDDEDAQNRYEQQMIALDKALDWNSRVYEQDSRAANAPAVNQYFLNNVFRRHLEPPERGIRAPNGELKFLYGSQGDPVSAQLTTVRDSDDDFIRRLILNKLLIPLDHRVYIPCRKLYHKFLNRTDEQGAHGVGGRTLEVIVSALETVFSVLCVSGTVILLYNLKSMKERLIATTFLSLIFPYPVIFLSKEAMRMFALTAAYWAVMVVFISTSTYRPSND